MNCGPETSIPDWMVEYPETSSVFDELRLDTSCGGKSLEYVCDQQGVCLERVLDRLHQAVERSVRQ